MTETRRPYILIKRAIDIVSAIAALLLLSPVIGITAVIVRAKLGSPVLFKQERPGLNGEIFTLYKFRSMLNVDESKGRVTNEQRIVPFGRWLRPTSLDELPSLVNVVKGDMSIVGPRPLRVDYLQLYTPEQARRHEVRPGITGLAQVRGRNELSWERRFESDIEYVDRYSFISDLRIIIGTLLTVFRREGIEGDGMAAMSAYVGPGLDDGLEESLLGERWLETRVKWLNDPSIRQGITIDFSPDLESTMNWFESLKTSLDRRDWVYTDRSGEPVAMGGIHGIGHTENKLYIYVNPKKHGCGHGSSVIRRLIRNARSFGADTLSLEVKETNENAIRMYERAGFTLTDNFMADGVSKRKYAIALKETL